MIPIGTMTYEKIEPQINTRITEHYANYWIASQIYDWLSNNKIEINYENIMEHINEINEFLLNKHKANLEAQLQVAKHMLEVAHEDIYYSFRVKQIEKQLKEMNGGE